MKPIRKAVIPAAGYGTRFLPATKSIPKEMIPIVDKPVIQYIVEEAIQSGIEEILIITGHGKRAIEDHFDTNVDLEYHLRQHGKGSLLEMVQDISEIKKQAMLGHYILTPDIFEILRRVQPDEKKNIKLAEALKIMASRQAVYTCEIKGKRYDIGDKLDYLKATVEYALRRPELKDAFQTYLNQYT